MTNSSVLIAPSSPTPNHTLHLSPLDSQLSVRFTFEYLLVYKPGHGLGRSTITNTIQSALGRALVPYYPLAGRVRYRADGFGLEVVCQAQGAVFIEAVSNSTVQVFEAAPVGPAQWREFLSVHEPDVLKGGPPVVVQLTWLSDGYATLAAGFNHCMCDGAGAAQFLNSVAEFARGLSELTFKPTWSRHLLGPASVGPRRGADSLGHHSEFSGVPDLCGLTSRYAREKTTPTMVTFDENRLTELRELARFTFTSFELLSAHVWRSWARALELPHDQIVRLVFTVNVRNRVMSPSLPSGYYGNAFVLACACAFAGELSEKGLGYAAGLVKRAKERAGEEEYLKEVLELVSPARRSMVDSVGVLIVSKWSRLGLESVDFGIGKPVVVESIYNGYCVLLPVCDRGSGYKVNMPVPSSVVDRYLCALTRNTCDG